MSKLALITYFLCFSGKISLDDVFKERDTLNHNIVGKTTFLVPKCFDTILLNFEISCKLLYNSLCFGVLNRTVTMGMQM